MSKLDFVLDKVSKELKIDKKLVSELIDISKKGRKLIVIKVPQELMREPDIIILRRTFEPLCNEKVHFLILPDTIKFETYMLDDKTFLQRPGGVYSERSPEYDRAVAPILPPLTRRPIINPGSSDDDELPF